MNAKLLPIKKIKLRKYEQIKEDKIKEKQMKANYHLNDCKFQFYWNKLEWVDQKKY